MAQRPLKKVLSKVKRGAYEEALSVVKNIEKDHNPDISLDQLVRSINCTSATLHKSSNKEKVKNLSKLKGSLLCLLTENFPGQFEVGSINNKPFVIVYDKAQDGAAFLRHIGKESLEEN